jgi:hypothetical protein
MSFLDGNPVLWRSLIYPKSLNVKFAGSPPPCLYCHYGTANFGQEQFLREKY